MPCNERGMAMVSVVLMLTVLLALAQVLVEKVWQSTRQAAAAASREQLLWTAQAGIESARRQLAANYAGSGGWQSLLTTTTARSYPVAPVWGTSVNGQRVEIYLRDNLDGDDDVGRDNDLKIYVLARALDRRGAEVMVESLCGFDPPFSEASTRSGQPVAESLLDLSGQPANAFDLVD